MTTINEQAQAYRKRLFPGFDSPLASTDPEFVERLDRFAFGEVPASDDLDFGIARRRAGNRPVQGHGERRVQRGPHAG